MNNIYLDTETTDFLPGQIAQLSMIVEDAVNFNLVGVYNYFFKVDDMTESAKNVHGLDINLLLNLSCGITFKDKYQEILEILQDSRIIAHNEVFDERFISSELWRCGVSFSPAARLCTMQYFKNIIQIPSRYRKHGAYKNPKLSEVINFLGINTEELTNYASELFNVEGSSFHDSRYDVASLYAAVNVYREKLNGGKVWCSRFCRKGGLASGIN